tara:strand:- start:104 stop:535 length:432 start_codon:yes stop_codon:yes gene_type:complete
MNHQKRKEVYQILELVESATTRQDKIKVLRENDIIALRDVLQGAFDPAVQFKLPAGTPPYTANEPNSAPSTLLRHHRFFKYFVVGVKECEQLSNVKREKMFIEVLESVHPQDAKIVIAMIAKKPPVKGLTKKLVQEALPDLIR